MKYIPFSVSAGRRSAPPLNLTGLPGTEKLNEKEKEVTKRRGARRERVGLMMIYKSKYDISFMEHYRVPDTALSASVNEIVYKSKITRL